MAKWLLKMNGSWTISWTNGKVDKYTINPDGELSIYGLSDVINLEASKNSAFPASDGWFNWRFGGRSYYMRINDGFLYLHQFSAGTECGSSYENLPGYCGEGKGLSVTG